MEVEPADFNCPAAPVFQTAVKISSEQRGEQSAVATGVFWDATQEQCVTITWPGGLRVPALHNAMGTTRPDWKPLPKCQYPLIGVHPLFLLIS